MASSVQSFFSNAAVSISHGELKKRNESLTNPMFEGDFGQSDISEKDLNERRMKNKRKNQGKGKQILRPTASVEIDLVERFSSSMPKEFNKTTKNENRCLDSEPRYQGKGKKILGSTITKVNKNRISVRVNRESVRDGLIPFHVELSTDPEEIERNPIGITSHTEIGSSRNKNAKYNKDNRKKDKEAVCRSKCNPNLCTKSLYNPNFRNQSEIGAENDISYRKEKMMYGRRKKVDVKEKEKQTKSKVIGTSKTSKKGEGKSSELESRFHKFVGIAFQNIEEIEHILICSTSKDLLDNRCSQMLARPIYQCRYGHLLCESCQKRSTKMCKTCENSNENTCNETLEKFFLRNLMAEYAVDYVSTAKTRFIQVSTTSFNWEEKKSRVEKMILMDIQSLERTLECPVCLELPRTLIEICHCRNGHHICHSCSSKVDTCPICKTDLNKKGHWRNIALERLIDFVHTASERYNREESNSEAHENEKKKEKRLLDKNVYGVVKWFNEEKGYGFIQRYDTKEEIIVFRDGVSKDSTVSSKTIQKADGVSFDIEIVQKGVKAVNVVVKGGARDKEKDEILEVEVFGVVNWYDIEKGYGFIRRYNTEEKVIVLKSGISKNRSGGTKSLQRDEAVMFDIVITKKGIKAVNVTCVDEDDLLKEN